MPSKPPITSLSRLNATAKDLFIQLYDLSPLDLDVLFILIRNDKEGKTPLTLEDLIEKADRDKSTIFRSLQKLVGLGLCIKEAKTLKEGGQYHVYSAVDLKTFKMETERRIRDLQKSLDRLLKKFEDDMQKAISSMYEK